MNIELSKDIDEPIRVKLQNVVDTVIKNLPETPEAFFVSTSTMPGEQSYLGVWLFTARLVVEIRNPLDKARVQYEMARLKDAVDWIRLNARNYKFQDHGPDSELELEFTTTDGLSSVLSANGAGCSELMNVYKCIFRPNFVAFVEHALQV